MRPSLLAALLASCSAADAPVEKPHELRIALRHVSAVNTATLLREVLPPLCLIRGDDGRRVCVRADCACTADPTDNSVSMRGAMEELAEFADLVARLDEPSHDLR